MSLPQNSAFAPAMSDNASDVNSKVSRPQYVSNAAIGQRVNADCTCGVAPEPVTSKGGALIGERCPHCHASWTLDGSEHARNARRDAREENAAKRARREAHSHDFVRVLSRGGHDLGSRCRCGAIGASAFKRSAVRR